MQHGLFYRVAVDPSRSIRQRGIHGDARKQDVLQLRYFPVATVDSDDEYGKCEKGF